MQPTTPDLGRAAARPATGDGVESRLHTFEERLEAFRAADRALSQVERHISDARGDPPLQAFWRGVKRDL